MNDGPKGKDILRFPRLDTVLMVEDYVRGNSGKFNKRKLWLGLPKKMMYQTFNVVIDYLIYSKKIVFDSNNKIIWIGQSQIFSDYQNKKTKGGMKND